MWDNMKHFSRLAILTSGLLVVLLPLLLMLRSSLQTPNGEWTGRYYALAWQQGELAWAFMNSLIVAIAVTLLQVGTAAIAGYALARLQFLGRQTLLLLIVATLVIPIQFLVVPIFLVLKWGNLINTYGALILPTAASGYSIFWMRQFFLGLPLELEEAAALDGASRWQTLTLVLLPLARPAIATLGLLTFVTEWNDLFKPLIFTTRPELRTAQLALASFQEQFTNGWPLMMAAAILVTIPIIVVFLLAQRQLLRGISTTGLKS